jgi:hypothetical protein
MFSIDGYLVRIMPKANLPAAAVSPSIAHWTRIFFLYSAAKLQL